MVDCFIKYKQKQSIIMKLLVKYQIIKINKETVSFLTLLVYIKSPKILKKKSLKITIFLPYCVSILSLYQYILNNNLLYYFIDIQMSKKNSYHPYELPENISHWETNFSQMKHKVIDYLKKHAQDQIHPIIDAQHYLILNSNNNNYGQNPSLSCVKINKDHISNHQEHLSANRGRQSQPLHDQNQQKTQKNNIFKNKCKVSLTAGSGHYFEQDYMRAFPPICSLQLEKQQKKSREGYHEATLKQKLESSNKFHLNNEQIHQNQVINNRQRYKSIEQRHTQHEVKSAKTRAGSTLKSPCEQINRIKTHYDNEKKNIFFIPVSQYLKQHQEDVSFVPIGTTTSRKKFKQYPNIQVHETKANDEPTKHLQSDTSLKDFEVANDVKLINTHNGLQHQKQTHNSAHKRFYAHAKQHKQEIKVLEKELFEKFVCSPWENIREEATIANIDIDP